MKKSRYTGTLKHFWNTITENCENQKALMQWVGKAFFVFGLLISLESQSQILPDTIELHEFVVIEKALLRNNLESDPIDSVLMEQLGQQSLAELINTSNVAVIKNYGRGQLSTISMNGTAASHTKLIWNGIPLNNPMLGQTDLAQIPLALWDGVSIQSGLHSVGRVSGGFGGAVQLISHMEPKTYDLLHVVSTLGSFQTHKVFGALSLGNKKFRSLTRLYSESSENNFDFINESSLSKETLKQKNASYTIQGLLQQFQWKPHTRHSFDFQSWNQWNHRNIPPIMTNLNRSEHHREEQADRFFRQLLTYNYLTENISLESQTAFMLEELNYFLIQTSPLNGDTLQQIESLNRLYTFRQNLFLNWNISANGFLNVQAFFQNHRVNSNNYDHIKRQRQYGFMAEAGRRWRNFSLGLTLRQEWFDGKSIPLIPVLKLNGVDLFSDKMQVSVLGGRNYNQPTLNDLNWVPGGNPDLEAEVGWFVQGEMDFKILQKAFQWKLSAQAYYSRIENWIQWLPTEAGPWSPVNFRKVYARGLRFGNLFIYGLNHWRFTLDISYQFTKTTDQTAFNGSQPQLPYIPEHQVGVWFNVLFKRWEAWLSWNHTGTRYTTLDNTNQYLSYLPSFRIMNASLSRNFKIQKTKWVIQLRFNNVLDANYQTLIWRPMPGRNYECTLSFKI